MATVFVDEAGYTGTNLLDPAQPVFALETHDLSESEAREVKSEFFGGIKAEVLKSSQLLRRSRHQESVLKFLTAMRGSKADRFKVYVTHKPFALICKLVDLVVETSMHRRGVDLYNQGANLGLANLIYQITESSPDRAYLKKLLAAIQELFLRPSKESAVELFDVLDSKTRLSEEVKDKDPLAEVLELPHLALCDLGPHVLTLSKEDLLVSFSIALRLISRWSEKHGSAFEVIHDESSVMLKSLTNWDRITSSSVPKSTVGRDRRTWEFPIGVTKTTFARDEDWVGLQVADVIAGAFAKALPFAGMLTESAPSSFELKLMEEIGQWQIEDGIWPQSKFTADELGTVGPKHPDAIDFFTRNAMDDSSPT